jgi:Protein of unknown function (DUF3313)
MSVKYITIPAMTFLLSLSACQTAPVADSGYLTNYEGGEISNKPTKASIKRRRDDIWSDKISKVFIAPANLIEGAKADFSDEEIKLVLNEVNRQTCFEISKRFEIASELTNDVTVIKTSIVKIKPTGRAVSGANAVAKYFLPLPIIEVRVPIELGGLAIESEMIDNNTNHQIAFMTWARNTKPIGTQAPSLSRVGDALQLTKPMAKDLANSFSTKKRGKRNIGSIDPCERFGSRNKIGHKLIGVASGLYIPEQ